MPQTLKARDRIGKYRIVKRLAQGGFACVFKALDTIEGVHVALKVPHAHLVTRESLELFRQEARVHAGLDHPNILLLKNADVVGDRFVIAYPLGERSLAERMQRRMALDTILDFAEQMLEGVAYAHGQSVIHCDLKPENFILFPDNRLRLADFSISRIALRTVHGSGSGTLGYMSPDQAMGRASFRSDVFSLGMILHEMITGECPEWPFEWPLAGHARLRQKLPKDFITFLRKALEVDPRRRFADANQMLSVFLKLKPRVRRFALGQRKRRAGKTGTSSRSDWKRMRFRHFAREYRTLLGLDRSCSRCDGPMSEPMGCCPWCGAKARATGRETKYPARCPRCKRGRKLDWRYCSWCYGSGFRESSERTYTDRRYEGRCATCRDPLIPFSRYCPWCRAKVRKPWKIEGTKDRCKKCGWTVLRDFWDHCPWCAQRLAK